MSDSEIAAMEQRWAFPEGIGQVVANCRGFTLIELLMIIVLISIISVSVMPKFLDTSAISLQGGAAMVAADIRYTQELAMSTHASKIITFATDDDSYMVVSQRMDLPSRVTISNGDDFTFNSLGEPDVCGSVQIEAGNDCKKICVAKDTGQVSVVDGCGASCPPDTCP